MTDSADGIRALLATYQTALNTSDAALAASCYTSAAVFMPTTLPTAIGDQMLAAYEAIFTAIRLQVGFIVDEVVVTGETTGFALTRSEGVQTVLATGATSPEANREIFLFAKESGDWKISRYMFNKAA
jgi:uncharacterized protein (TIGR02246 family)